MGPTFPLSKPLRLLEGIYNLSDNLMFSPDNEFEVVSEYENVVVVDEYNKRAIDYVNWLYTAVTRAKKELAIYYI